MSDNKITLYRQPESPEEYLEHHGVKGMKWGVRRNRDSGGSDKPRKISRGENRRLNKKAEREFYQNKINDIFEKSLKLDTDIFIAANTGGPITQIMTGREFVIHMANGGLLNPKTSEIWAVNENKFGIVAPQGVRQYQYQDFRKK